MSSLSNTAAAAAADHDVSEPIQVPSTTVVTANDVLDHDQPQQQQQKEQRKTESVEDKPTVNLAGPSVSLQLVPLQVSQITSNYSSGSLVEIPLHDSSDDEFADIDGGLGDEEEDEIDAAEHADHLSPLMMDNHTIVEHHEGFQQRASPSHSPIVDLCPVMVVDSAGNITIMKHSETKDSLSSMEDSDLGSSSSPSFSLHHRHREQQNSVDDSQGNNSSSDNDPSRDSGCETGPCVPTRPYCPVEVDEGVEVAHHDDNEDLPDEERPFEVPDEEFCERIVEQVEFYFSNESILKDAFLLKHVRRNKEGFVSLKLVSSFKRVRQLTKDWRVVGNAVQRKSKLVELNDVGTKVRRLEPLPNYDETMPSRTVVATDLGLEKISIEKVYELFSRFGEIALVRILRVGGPIPADVRQFINKYPELLQKECALVEFVESRSARNALACEGITVLEMIAPKKKTGKKAAPVTRIVDGHQPHQPSMMMHSAGSGMDNERSRGGVPLENSTAPRFQIRRTASGYYSKPDQVIYVPPPRKFGYSNGYAPNAGFAHQSHHQQHHQPQSQFQSYQPHHHFAPAQPQSPPASPEHYEVYRRTSNGHIVAVSGSPIHGGPRRFSDAPPLLEMRRGSQPLNEMMSPRKMHSQQPVAVPSPQPVHECQCNCQAAAAAAHHVASPQPRRLSITSPAGNCTDLMYRRTHQQQQQNQSQQLTSCSPVVVESSPRKGSLGNPAFERKTSVTETNWRNEAPVPERKYSTEHHHQMSVPYHHGHHPESPIRKFSNGFDPLRKLSNADEYVNGRRISTDSGYDRKYSFSSDCSNARSRSNSFICTHAPVIEQVIRAPTGPAGDGSRGFGQRTRKIGHILPPI